MTSPSYKKTISTKISSPRAKASGMSKFPHATELKNAPLKTRIYTKGILREDPSQFGGASFGDTGMNESPSILGMGKNAR